MDLLHAHRVSPFELRSSRLVLFAIRICFAPSVRKSAFVEKADFTLKGTLLYGSTSFRLQEELPDGRSPGERKAKADSTKCDRQSALSLKEIQEGDNCSCLRMGYIC